MEASVPTRFLVLSDTHGKTADLPTQPFDVLIHCGDLTHGSELHEFTTTISMLQKVDAPLKLVIPGNHDWTLDPPIFSRKLSEAKLHADDDAVKKTYGAPGDVRKLFRKSEGIHLLDEGTHGFKLANGAILTVYASPYTPSTNDWGFQYDPREDHAWDIGQDVDVAITHGPPLGIFDRDGGGKRAGSSSLFKAIAQSRPKMHCFGHMHAGWGAKTVRWKDSVEAEISHFTSIDNEQSKVIESLATMEAGKFDSDETKMEKREKMEELRKKRYCSAMDGVKDGEETLFVNAAIEANPTQLPWVVDVALPRVQGDGSTVAKGGLIDSI